MRKCSKERNIGAYSECQYVECGSWLAVMSVNRNGDGQFCMMMMMMMMMMIIIIIIIIIIMYVRVLSLMLLMMFPVVTPQNTNVSDNSSERTL